MLNGGLDHFGWETVFLIGAGGRNLSADAKAAFHGLEQVPDDGAVGRDLHLHSVVVLEVDYGECLAGSVEDVLGDVEGTLVAFGAESTAFAMEVIRVCAGGAVRGVSGECFHDIELVVVGQTRVGGGDGREAYLAGWGSH